LFFTDDPFAWGWGSQTVPGTVVRFVPISKVDPAPRPPSYQEAVRGEPVRPGSSKAPPSSAQVLSFASLVPDLSRLREGAQNNAPVAV
jgi:hypothetical protein